MYSMHFFKPWPEAQPIFTYSATSVQVVQTHHTHVLPAANGTSVMSSTQPYIQSLNIPPECLHTAFNITEDEFETWFNKNAPEYLHVLTIISIQASTVHHY